MTKVRFTYHMLRSFGNGRIQSLWKMLISRSVYLSPVQWGAPPRKMKYRDELTSWRIMFWIAVAMAWLLMMLAAVAKAQPVTSVEVRQGSVVTTLYPPTTTMPAYPAPTDGIVFDATFGVAEENAIRAAHAGSKFYFHRGRTYAASQWWDIANGGAYPRDPNSAWDGIIFEAWGDPTLPQPIIVAWKGWEFSANKGEVIVRQLHFTATGLSAKGDQGWYLFLSQPRTKLILDRNTFTGVDNIVNGNGGGDVDLLYNAVPGELDMRGYTVWFNGGNYNIIGNYIGNSTDQCLFRGTGQALTFSKNKLIQKSVSGYHVPNVNDKASYDVLRASAFKSIVADDNEITGIIATGPIQSDAREPGRDLQFVDKATFTRTHFINGEFDIRGNTRFCTITGTTGTTRGNGFVVMGGADATWNTNRWIDELIVRKSENAGVVLAPNEPWAWKPDANFIVKSLVVAP